MAGMETDMLALAATVKLACAGLAAGWIGIVAVKRLPQPLFGLWSVFCAGFVAVMLIEVFGRALGPAYPVLAVMTCATCSVFWLTARALFRRHFDSGWFAALILAGVFIPTIFDQIAVVTGAGSLVGDEFIAGTSDRLDGVQTLFSSLALALAFREGLDGWGPRMAAGEKRMRLLFLVSFGSGVGICVFLFDHGRLDFISPDVTATIQAACALAILASMSIILRHRLAHPLPTSLRPEATTEDLELGKRIRKLVESGAYLDAELKVADLARRLQERDYKVSRAIASGLGEANFNRFVNRYRIDHAKAMLRDPAFADRSILDVALESGFASLGPFNRAFREATGQTPREYRRGSGTGSPAEDLVAS
ncbi:MAG: helix-turn-helix domain-containing protein [Alphaproteobacteria bacterium]|nr:helix-turn-helix domain-containing protein [Alphaproteobacteria bacterium]